MSITPGCVKPTFPPVYCIHSSHANSCLPFHICEDYLETYILCLYRFIPKQRTLKKADFISHWATAFKNGSPACGSTLLHLLCRDLKPTTLSAPVQQAPFLPS